VVTTPQCLSKEDTEAIMRSVNTLAVSIFYNLLGICAVCCFHKYCRTNNDSPAGCLLVSIFANMGVLYTIKMRSIEPISAIMVPSNDAYMLFTQSSSVSLGGETLSERNVISFLRPPRY
jgi:hypothetical protein